MKRIFALFAATAALAAPAFAADYTPVPCGTFGVQASSCDACFDGGRLYQGIARVGLYDDFINNGDVKATIFADNGMLASFTTLNPSTTWVRSVSMFQYSPAITWHTSTSGRAYVSFDPHTTTRLVT